MPKNVLVVGAPRSGTSMTALMFARQGYFVTEDEDRDLQEPNEFNPNGYWEADSIKKSNAQILHRAGFEFDNTWMFDPIEKHHTEAIFELTPSDADKQLIEQFEKKSPWIWKDPRLCYTLAYWWPILNHENTRVLLLKRDPDEVYQSFLRLNWVSGKHSKNAMLRRIIEHMEFAEYTVNKLSIPHILVNYADYERAGPEVAKGISETFDLSIKEEDIGYNKKYKTSGLYSSFWRLQNNIADMLPASVRAGVKKLIPRSLLKLLFPHRFQE